MTGFLKWLKHHQKQGRLTRQQHKTLHGQALAGDISGANKTRAYAHEKELRTRSLKAQEKS